MKQLELLQNIQLQQMKKTEDIGARRLHTVIEKVIEDISFEADEKKGTKVIVTKELVAEKLDDIVDNVDTARYIL